jgi:hypothetical protein
MRPYYEVRYWLVVDHPELRGPTFPEVDAGTVILNRDSYQNRKDAIQFAKGLVTGGYDFGSEYVRAVEVLQMLEGQSPRYIRRRVNRERTGP